MYKILAIEKPEIWSLDEIKNYLRVTHDYDNNLITNLLNASIMMAENFTKQNLWQRQVEFLINKAGVKIYLPQTPILNIENFFLIKEENNQQDIANNFGQIDHTGNFLHLKKEYVSKKLKLKYKTGYTDAIPAPIRHGILLHIASMYDSSNCNYDLPANAEKLYLPYRRLNIYS
ncbi:MAG: phage gp6-like head-tail connector protein [Rickettsiaceae bacterium]|nr:phage gp6-like head-tail connector protein [Rickettsiaceae bacterium]